MKNFLKNQFYQKLTWVFSVAAALQAGLNLKKVVNFNPVKLAKTAMAGINFFNKKRHQGTVPFFDLFQEI